MLFDADDDDADMVEREDAGAFTWKPNGALVMCWLFGVGVWLSLLYGG